MPDSEQPTTTRSRNAWTFYYDADCRMCTAVVRWLRWCDWRNRILWSPIQALESPPSGIAWEDLERSAYLVCAPGDNHEGFFAFRRLFMALPVLFPLGALMWLPGGSLIGVAVYRLVADNRHRISRCEIPGRSRR